jgi:hypothetical protein
MLKVLVKRDGLKMFSIGQNREYEGERGLKLNGNPTLNQPVV